MNTFANFTATAWPEADRLFRSNPLWLGGDGADSVDLGNGHVLWLFGDSFIASKRGATRRQSTFVHNSMAIEHGYNPAHASLRFYWRLRSGKPTEFAANQGDIWLWPTAGVRIGNKLLLFFSKERADSDKNSMGFQNVGWTAFVVDNSDAEPASWKLREVKSQPDPWHAGAGLAAYSSYGFVYAFGGSEPHNDFYLERWPVSAAIEGDLSSSEWWCGPKKGWQKQKDMQDQRPAIVIPKGPTESAVQWNPRFNKFIEAESIGFGASDIAIRWADRLEGPWSAPLKIYHPPESNRPDAFVYAGKLHAGLTGADIVITYVDNSNDSTLAADMSIYFPRFVRLNFAKH